jgi:hypothetical protein
MLLPMVSPYDDDQSGKNDVSDISHNQAPWYSLAGTSMEGGQAKKIRDIKANFQQSRQIPILLAELPLRLL